MFYVCPKRQLTAYCVRLSNRIIDSVCIIRMSLCLEIEFHIIMVLREALHRTIIYSVAEFVSALHMEHNGLMENV